MQCPACGTLNGRADRMCRMCGGTLPEPVKAPPIEVGPPPEEDGIGAGREPEPTASAATVAHRVRTSPPRCPSCFAVNVYSAVFCRSCGARLPEEPVYEVPDGGSAMPASGDRTGPAWENGTGFFDLGALFATMRDVLLSPNVTFSNMRREGGGARPVTYVLAMHLVFLPVWVAMIWFAGRELRTMAHQWSEMTLPAADAPAGASRAQGEAFVELMRQAQEGRISPEELERRMQELATSSQDAGAAPAGEPGATPSGAAPPQAMVGAGMARMVDTMLGPVGLLIAVPIGLLFGALMSLGVGTLLIHLSLRLVGGARTIETTFRALCYASGSAAPLQLVPLVGTSIGTIWALVVNVLAQARAHDISAWRVIGGYLLMVGLIFCGTCALAIL